MSLIAKGPSPEPLVNYHISLDSVNVEQFLSFQAWDSEDQRLVILQKIPQFSADFLRIGCRLCILTGKKVIVVKPCFSQCTLPGNTRFLFVPLLVMLTLIISTRCCLASFPTVKLSLFLLQFSHVCGEVLEPFITCFLSSIVSISVLRLEWLTTQKIASHLLIPGTCDWYLIWQSKHLTGVIELRIKMARLSWITWGTLKAITCILARGKQTQVWPRRGGNVTTEAENGMMQP